MQTDLAKQTNWFQVLYTSIFFAGTLLLLFPIFITMPNPTKLVIISYSLLTLTLGMVTTHVYLKMAGRLNEFYKIGLFTFLYNIVRLLAPFLVVLALLTYSLYLYGTYQEIIDKRRTSQQYYVFSTMSLILMIIQFIILFNGLGTQEYKTDHLLPRIYTTGMTFFGVLNGYILLVMGYMLSSYTTDG